MMNRTRLISPVLVLMACGLLAGCGGGDKKPASAEALVGLTKEKKDELTAKFKTEAKQAVTKENAEKIAKDLEAEISADAEK